ncbi:MAG: hypothetical protein KF855_06500 [Acidobacteria bacterium]|nr:hypothetical protein [Acidobacteriota bacterium]
MFCSGCGTKIQEGLNYCSRCGKRAAEDTASRPSLAESLTVAVGYIGSAGFLGFIFVVLILSRSGFPPNQMVPIVFFYFAALFGICFLILRQAGQLAGKNKDTEPAIPQGKPEQQAYIHPANTAQLVEPRDLGIASVTEHTTRTLEKTPVERN